MKYSFLRSTAENAAAILNQLSTIPLMGRDITVTGTTKERGYQGTFWLYYFFVQGSAVSDILIDDGAPIKMNYKVLDAQTAIADAGIGVMYVNDITKVTNENLAEEIYKACKIYLPEGFTYKVESTGVDGLGITATLNAGPTLDHAFALLGNFTFSVQNLGNMRLRLDDVVKGRVTDSFIGVERVEFIDPDAAE